MDSTQNEWRKTLETELEIVRTKASEPCPDGVDPEDWRAVTAPYSMEIPILKALIDRLDDAL